MLSGAVPYMRGFVRTSCAAGTSRLSAQIKSFRLALISSAPVWNPRQIIGAVVLYI